MSTVREITDFIAIAVTPGVDLEAEQPYFNEKVYYLLWEQYEGKSIRPFGLVVTAIDWHTTQDPDEVAKFQPGDGCPTCTEGNMRARLFLLDQPNGHVVMANITFTEVWPPELGHVW